MPSKNQTKSWVVYLATFPPRECGIATFTRDLIESIDDLFLPQVETKVVAMQEDSVKERVYPSKVISTITHSKQEEYIATAKMLNSMDQVKLVHVQHEFGIYGGDWGIYLLDFLDAIKKPVCVTCHTVLPSPNAQVLKVVKGIAKRANKMFVMTKLSKTILMEQYGVPEEKIAIIPHGIHPAPYTDGTKEKKKLKLSGRTIISTFGFLNFGKGIEYALQSLPKVVEKYPDVLYLIIGETHPVVKKREGERYREFLMSIVKKLKIEKNVAFHDRFLTTDELLEFLSATNVYLSMSTNPDQAVSGTLSYALGAGRCVISTAFAQAKEDVSEEVGILVGFEDPKPITDALMVFLDNRTEMLNRGKNAYFRTRRMTWQNVALAVMKQYATQVEELLKPEQSLLPIKLDHIVHLTDRFGIIQFAQLSEPELSSGYTLDDNARAMQAMTLYHEKYEGQKPVDLVSRYLKAIEHMADSTGKGFRNYVNLDGSFVKERNSVENLEDANARCFEALATVFASESLTPAIRRRAGKIIRHNFNFSKKLNSPRAASYFTKGIVKLLHIQDDIRLKNKIVEYADFMLQRFADAKSEEEKWYWFEDILSYSNGSLPDALLQAYEVTKDERYFEVGKRTLDFLIEHSFKDTVCFPIGQSGWFKKGGARYFYDQQPEEVAALVGALKTMHRITQNEFYEERLYQAFNWFLGNNSLGQIVYDHTTGGCYDGLGEKEINLNQGAESTVVYLLARLNF